MHGFALLLLAALPTQPAPAGPVEAAGRQAQATVRVVSGAALRFADIERDRPASLRDSMIRAADGTPQRARLVEFE